MGLGGRGGRGGRGRGRAPPPLRSSQSNITLGTNSARETSRSLTVQGENANTYDASANIIIGIDDTVPIEGLIVPDANTKPAITHTAGDDSKGGSGGGGQSRQDPYGVGLTESELSYVSAENKMILIEVRLKECAAGCGE
jgi:hypothetical protein